MARLLFLAPVFAAIAVVVYFVFLKSPPPLPNVDLEEWWGPVSQKGKQDERVRPFKIKFKDPMIQDLKMRFKAVAPFTPPFEGVGADYGFNSNELSEWIQYWAEEYPFAERAQFLNQFQNYRTVIQGLNIHFVSVRSEVPQGVEVVPILLLHGWPGSVREFYEAIPLLIAPDKSRDFALEVVVPSLPGYGFSDAAVRPGLGAAEVAVIFRNLMQRLGFKQYYVQGGDWGAFIGSYMATLFPEEVLGFHTNMALSMAPTATALETLGSLYPPLVVDNELADRMYPLKDIYSFLLQETGYMHIQATKPDTIGVALTDSPVGLLAYILEKFSTWTDRGAKPLTTRFSKEKLIDNLMYYWTTTSITTSMRLYAETFNKRHFGLNLDTIPTPVPTWALQAKYELSYQPPFIIKLKFPNLVNTTVLHEGGHFVAFELPKVFAEDVLKAIGQFRILHRNKAKTEL